MNNSDSTQSLVSLSIRFLRYRPWICSLILIMLAWFATTYFGWVGKTLIASPQEVWGVVLQAFASGATKSEQFHIHAAHTILRALNGWLIATTSGLLIGIGLGSIEILHRATEPVFEFVRSIPPVLAFPLFLVAFNFQDVSFIWTVVFGALPIMVLTVARGTQRVSKARKGMLKAFGAPALVRFVARIFEILPSVFLGARLTLSMSLIIAVVSEMVFTPRNGFALGALARDSEIDFDTPMFYTCVITIGLFGYIMNYCMKQIEHRLGNSNGAQETT